MSLRSVQRTFKRMALVVYAGWPKSTTGDSGGIGESTPNLCSRTRAHLTRLKRVQGSFTYHFMRAHAHKMTCEAKLKRLKHPWDIPQ